MTPTLTPIPCLAVESEPNDTRAQASVAPPLCQGSNVEGYLREGDEVDIYWIEVASPGTLDVILYNPPNADYDLLVYAWSAPNDLIGRSRREGPVAERVVVDVDAGRYYVAVWPYDGSSDVAYLLKWAAH